MNQTTIYDPTTAGISSVGERTRVLRNTYWLLALSMVPTVLGAWLGVTTGIARVMSPGIGLIVFLVGAFGFMFAIEKNKNSAAGVPILPAFTFFMGLMLSRLVGAGRSRGPRGSPPRHWSFEKRTAGPAGRATLTSASAVGNP
jgi:modulator of FtsH protease